MDRQRRVQEKGKDLIVQMQSVSETMKSNADKLSTTLTSEIQKQFHTLFKRFVSIIIQKFIFQATNEIFFCGIACKIR